MTEYYKHKLEEKAQIDADRLARVNAAHAKKVEAFDAVKATAHSWGLEALSGSEKQVVWAEKLRADFLERQESEIDDDCLACLASNPAVQTASFWIEYASKEDDKIFDFLLNDFTEEELAVMDLLSNLNPLLDEYENKIEWASTIRRKFFESLDSYDDELIEKVAANKEAQQADFWITLRLRAPATILSYATGEKSIKVVYDDIKTKNDKAQAKRDEKRNAEYARRYPT